MIKPEIDDELFAYIAGILKNHQSRCLAINGTKNHLHILISQSKNVALSLLVGEVKKSSSKWIKTKGSTFGNFDWQDGYGAFSIGRSAVPALQQYIARQKEHHKTRSFEAEFRELLKKYGVEYHEQYVWG